MIDIQKIAAEAASQFGLSLKDDPTAWDAAIDAAGASRLDQVAPEVIQETCQLAAAANALSAVNRALGAASEKIATAMDVAIHEDGPLADLPGVWAAHVSGLALDTSGVAGAAGWQGRVDALRAAIKRTAHAAPPATISDVLAYMNSDPRFDGLGALKKGVAALDEPFTPPAFLAKGRNPTDVVDWEDETGAEYDSSTDGGPVADTWDDEPETPAPAKGKRKAPGKPAPPSRVPGFPAMLNVAGVTKADVARLCGYSESYIGYIFAGRKPWPGLRPEQVKALRDEVGLRHDALAEALTVLGSGSLLLPAEA